jgi:sterol desaturase/sphingolipid hydroxylase (fatty acid hydroxylase superfamily)
MSFRPLFRSAGVAVVCIVAPAQAQVMVQRPTFSNLVEEDRHCRLRHNRLISSCG